MGNTIQSMSGSRPTARELREERETLRIYRTKEIQNLRDLKAKMEVDRSKNEFREDIAKANMRIDAAITYIQSHNEDEVQLFLDSEKPFILTFISTFPDRAHIRRILAAIAAATNGTTLKGADKKSLIQLSATLRAYLDDPANFGKSSEEVRAFVLEESERTLTSILKTDTPLNYKTYLQETLLLTEEDIVRLRTSPAVIKKTTYIGPNYTSIAIKTAIACIVIGIAITGGMLAANDVIHRGIQFRLLNFIYGGIFCFITLPYYLIRMLRGKAPKYYSLLPLYERKEEPNTAFREVIAALFSFVKDDNFRAAEAAFKAQQDAMISK